METWTAAAGATAAWAVKARTAVTRTVPARARMAVKAVRVITRAPSRTEIAVAVATIIARADEHAAFIAAIIRVTAIIGAGVPAIAGIAAIARIAVTISGRVGVAARERNREAKTKRHPGRSDALQKCLD
jgi:ribonuclease HIII